ncbi:protocadherin-11 X-linked-like [Mixophyes fleayi]|uniref:protocadherin-11 X-linked-like n=1 Tax=Mixophyes fleayi TaxID=3061075 RepID=UPI003F4DC335
MDPKGYYSTVPVHLDIKDVDTMNPHFIFPMYNASISENQRGNLSTHPEEIKAIDGDIGINETIYYYISNVYPQEFRNVISINHSDGVISLNREMDRESVSLITVQIKAVQQDNPLKSVDSVVLITILDENDNPPKFSQSIYESYIAEDSPIGSNVLVLTASDKDKDGISKGYFSTNNTMFKVDKTGIMYFIHGELDREFTPEMTVKVWVFDAESNGLNSSALVIINIIDVNDNNPEFHNLPLFFTIPEGNYTSTSPLLLGKVNATDPDEGANGQITITQTSDNGDKTFIVQQNGIIIVQGLLDRETKDRYPISLMASDSGTPPRKVMR